MTRVRRRLTLVTGLAGAIALWVAPHAGAAVTSSQITSPSDPTYTIFDQDNPNTIAVSGTTNGTTGDQVDVKCFHGSPPSSANVATNVAVQADGSFSAPTGNLSNINESVCRLRAVPAGTTPADLTPFAGPVIGAGYRSTSRISGPTNPNNGTPYDFYIWAQQLTAANDYDSVGGCGMDDGYLFDSNMHLSTTTWYCNDWYWWYENYADQSSSTRSQIRVDGVDALNSETAQDVNGEGTPGFPAVNYSYSIDPATGNLTIKDSEPIVKCSDSSYPPNLTKCGSFVSTGVRIDRTITQESDGHLVFFTDNWVSTDGKDHSIDLLPQNDQCFGSSCSATDIQYKFPGESSFSAHANGDTVPFSGSAPAAVYVNVQGAADGDTATGQGAIVFDRPASPATFNNVVSYDSDFYFHQTGTATASCPATFRFAYAADYDSADVQSLAQSALSRFATPVACPTSGPTGKRAAALRNCKKKFKKALKKKKAHDALTKPAKKHLKKKFKKCKRKARKLPV